MPTFTSTSLSSRAPNGRKDASATLTLPSAAVLSSLEKNLPVKTVVEFVNSVHGLGLEDDEVGLVLLHRVLLLV